MFALTNAYRLGADWHEQTDREQSCRFNLMRLEKKSNRFRVLLIVIFLNCFVFWLEIKFVSDMC